MTKEITSAILNKGDIVEYTGESEAGCNKEAIGSIGIVESIEESRRKEKARVYLSWIVCLNTSWRSSWRIVPEMDRGWVWEDNCRKIGEIDASE